MSVIELGGFAEWPEDIDGTEEEFERFNHCLAEEYYDAVLGEDFERLGKVLNDGAVWHQIMDDVCYWLNYDGEIDENIKDNLDMLCNGTIITCNNRPFILAAHEHGWITLANYLIRNNNEKGIGFQKTKN